MSDGGRRSFLKARIASVAGRLDSLAWADGAGSYASTLQPAVADNNQMVEKYVKHMQLANCVDFQCANAMVRLEICLEDIIRIRMTPSGKLLTNEPWVVIRYDWPDITFTLKDNGTYFSIATQRMLVKVFKEPFRLEMCDLEGKVINQDCPEGGWDIGTMK